MSLDLPDNHLPHWKNIHTIVFDFDGVFTDNKVWVDQNGIELVCCNRGDGLGFDLLRGFIKLKKWNLNYFILSKENNPVVSTRANKMQVSCVQSISDKNKYLTSYLMQNNLDSKGLIYLGNDLNDLKPIHLAGFSVAPSDSHPIILANVDLVLLKKGGDGFVREFIELLIKLKNLPDETINKLL